MNAYAAGRQESAAGYPIQTTIYECAQCADCPKKDKCIKAGSKKPLEERSKRLHVSKTFLRQRDDAYNRITTEEGINLRLNRSIQVEGAFGVLTCLPARPAGRSKTWLSGAFY
jgi:hypothetical protein